MADMITADALKEKLQQLPSMPVVTYVNSPAAVKALSTICCTSANAVQVVNSLKSDDILMAPDRNLAQYTATKTDKNIHIWNGYCPIHDRLSPEDVMNAKSDHPEAVFMAHPECRPDVLALADEVVSTSGMIRLASESNHSDLYRWNGSRTPLSAPQSQPGQSVRTGVGRHALQRHEKNHLGRCGQKLGIYGR